MLMCPYVNDRVLDMLLLLLLLVVVVVVLSV
jgi:hypothetical protein